MCVGRHTFANYPVNYPSRKIMWGIILGIVVILAAFAFIEFGKPSSTKAQDAASPIAVNPTNGVGATLADNDWQKVLIGTDLAAAQGKNLGTVGGGSGQAAPLTETSKLGEYLVSEYLQMEQSGQAMSTDTINSLVSSALNNPSIVPTAKVYAFSDIKIGKSNTITDAITYGQSVGALFNTSSALGNEAVYARDAIEQNNPAISAKIDPIITTYQNILKSLLGTVVPPSLAKIHIDLVNAMSTRLMVAQMLRKINSDPAAGLEGAGQYMNGLQTLSNALLELKQYLDALKTKVGTMTATSSNLNLDQ